MTGIVPQEFDKDKLTCFSSDQFVTWDEVHRKVQPGTDDEGSLPITNNDNIMKFPRDENGKLDMDNGAYSKSEVTKMNCNPNPKSWSSRRDKKRLFGCGGAKMQAFHLFEQDVN